MTIKLVLQFVQPCVLNVMFPKKYAFHFLYNFPNVSCEIRCLTFVYKVMRLFTVFSLHLFFTSHDKFQQQELKPEFVLKFMSLSLSYSFVSVSNFD